MRIIGYFLDRMDSNHHCQQSSDDAQCQIEGIQTIVARLQHGEPFVGECAECGEATAESHGEHQSHVGIPLHLLGIGIEETDEETAEDVAYEGCKWEFSNISPL